MHTYTHPYVRSRRVPNEQAGQRAGRQASSHPLKPKKTYESQSTTATTSTTTTATIMQLKLRNGYCMCAYLVYGLCVCSENMTYTLSRF